MHDQPAEGPEAQEGSCGATSQDQPEGVMEGTGQRELQVGQEEPERGVLQHWEGQWQQFLQTLRSSNSAWGSPTVPDSTPWEDAKAFLASFEQVAAACGWPRGEWVSRLTPALKGEALQAISLLQARDKEDYGKVKAAILREEAFRREAQRQHFRQFCWQELEDPQKNYVQIQALCCQWLKPERHTKEEILELLVLEQFLASLPEEAHSWVRAGGPDSCAQAVALLEDFLMSRRMAEMGTWQEPLQELSVVVLDTKMEHLDLLQGGISKEHEEIYKDTEQNINGDITVAGIGIPRATLLMPQEYQDMSEAELNKASDVDVNQVRQKGVTLHMVEQTPMQSTQQTTFWKILQEDGENMDSLDDEKGHQLKVKHAQVGESEQVEVPRNGKRIHQENVSVMDEKSETHSGHRIEPLMGCQESGENTRSLGAACRNLGQEESKRGKALFSKYGRRYKPKLYEHHSSQMEVKNSDGLECEGSLHSYSLAKHEITHTREKGYKCADYGKRFCQSSDLLRHEILHTGMKPHKCPECGKSFSVRSTLLTHQMIHTGEKPHKCPECGKSFSLRSTLLTHQMIHTGEKPHKCPECGKSFSLRSTLLTHQMIHTGEKPHKCPECGKSFSVRSTLLTHQMIHTGEKPHKCPECGKSFSRRSTLLAHQLIHRVEKPHKCPECGKSFSQITSLLNHEIMHTIEKPHKCPECGKSFSCTSLLLRHKMTHTGEKPHKCTECGKCFSSRSNLLRHKMMHTGEKPHRCSECGAKFSRRSHLLRHGITHRRETTQMWKKHLSENTSVKPSDDKHRGKSPQMSTVQKDLLLENNFIKT